MNPVAVLIPAPPLLQTALIPEDALELVAGLRSLDPLAPASLVAPVAARPSLEPALLALGFARAVGAPSPDATTPTSGLRPDAAARLLKSPLDVYELSVAARPLAAVGLTPQAALPAAREAAKTLGGSWPLAVQRLARERDLEGLTQILELTNGDPAPAITAFVQHRVVLTRADVGAVTQAARALKSGLAPHSTTARAALGFAARLLFPVKARAQGIPEAVARDLDLALADILIDAATPAGGDPLADLEPDALAPSWTWPAEAAKIVAALRADPDERGRAAVSSSAELPKAARGALDLRRALEAFATAAEPTAREAAATALGAMGLAPEALLALALAAKHALGLTPTGRRRLHRTLARGLEGGGRDLIESVLPELAGLDTLIASGLGSATKASSRAELVSARRRAGALALARLAEVASEPKALRAELDRASALLEAHAKAAPAATPRRDPNRKPGQTGRLLREPEGATDDLDWELVALGIEETLVAPDADRTALATRARTALERWTAAPERAPLGFLAPALRLLASTVSESPFPGEPKDARRFEARALFHLTRRAWKSEELPRDLVEAVIERRRVGVGLSELARRLDATVTTALLFEGLPSELAATLADELGQVDGHRESGRDSSSRDSSSRDSSSRDSSSSRIEARAGELRLVRRLDATSLLGRFERGFVRVRFFPEDEPPLERVRALVRPAGSGPDGVARPVAALDSARVRGGLGVGWALACAHVAGARLAPEDLPRGEDAPAFVAALARALAAQHAWGLVHGPLRLDEIVVGETGEPVFTGWDLAASLEGSLDHSVGAGPGRARDLEALLQATGQLKVPQDILDAARAAAGDLASEGAGAALASALEASARKSDAQGHGRSSLDWLRARRSVDRSELRGLLRDALAGEAPRSLAEIEARVPGYLPYRGAVDQGLVRDELLALAEEGWASGEFSLEIDARRGVFQLRELSA